LETLDVIYYFKKNTTTTHNEFEIFFIGL